MPQVLSIRGLTCKTMDHKAVRASWGAGEVIATAVVLGLVAAIYLYFSFWV